MERSQNRQRLSLGTIALLAVAVRLIAIDQPFIDDWSWRQSDVAAIARNYLNNGFHFAYPQIDWAGGAPGYVGTEFPILPFAAAVCYKFTGIHEWVGRLQAVLFFAVSLPFFFGFVRQLFTDTTAVWAMIFYGFAPLSIMSSRCFMPDVPSLSLSIISLYYFASWLNTSRGSSLLISAVTLSLAVLIKLPTAIIGAPLAALAFHRFGRSAIRRSLLWGFAFVVLAPSFAWYWHAANVAQRYFPHHFFGAGGVRLMSPKWYGEIIGQTVTSSLTVVPVVLAAIGLFVGRKQAEARAFYWWFVAIGAFIIVVGYGNRHPWYQLPLVMVVAVFAGCAMEWIQRQLSSRSWPKAATVFFVLAAFALQSYSGTRDLYRPAAADLRLLGLALKERTPTGSLIVVPDYGDPTALYYGERKGWHFLEKDGIYNGHPSTEADAIADLEQLGHQGATHIAFYSDTFWWLKQYREFAQYLENTAVSLEQTAAYQIFELKPR